MLQDGYQYAISHNCARIRYLTILGSTHHRKSKMAEGFTRKFNFEDSLDDDSGIGMKSGTNSIELDSEARSVRSWESESERSWENESDDEDEDALGNVLIFDQHA